MVRSTHTSTAQYLVFLGTLACILMLVLREFASLLHVVDHVAFAALVFCLTQTRLGIPHYFENTLAFDRSHVFWLTRLIKNASGMKRSVRKSNVSVNRYILVPLIQFRDGQCS